MNVQLIPLDMSKSKKHEHPHIDAGQTYLVKYNGSYFAGRFVRVWFGWSFTGWHAPLQFDAPGWNRSRWEQIWAIVEDVEAVE